MNLAMLIRIGTLAGLLLAPSLAFAFGEGQPGLDRPASPPSSGYGFSVPQPDAAEPDEDLHAPDAPDAADAPAGPLPEVHYDLASLPPPVAAMREKIIAAARSADYEALRAVIGLSNPPPVFSALGEGDPVDILKAAAGDAEGYETLAILLDVLDAGWVIKDEGTPQARYIWPYFAEYPPDALTPRQLVEAYRVLTAGDFEQMRGVGSYEFFRAEIAADGRWLLFLSGD